MSEHITETEAALLAKSLLDKSAEIQALVDELVVVRMRHADEQGTRIARGVEIRKHQARIAALEEQIEAAQTVIERLQQENTDLAITIRTALKVAGTLIIESDRPSSKPEGAPS